MFSLWNMYWIDLFYMYEKLLLFLSQIISQIFKDRNQTLHIPNHKIDKRKVWEERSSISQT